MHTFTFSYCGNCIYIGSWPRPILLQDPWPDLPLYQHSPPTRATVSCKSMDFMINYHQLCIIVKTPLQEAPSWKHHHRSAVGGALSWDHCRWRAVATVWRVLASMYKYCTKVLCFLFGFFIVYSIFHTCMCYVAIYIYIIWKVNN